jgi:ribose 5-phosphate isomerase B
MHLRVALAADHAGFELKERLLGLVGALGHEAVDLGTDSLAPVDYPDFAMSLGEAIVSGAADRGVLICGSGVGASVAVNKIPGIRGGICHDTYSAHQGVEHDNMNVLVLGGRVIGDSLAAELVRAFLGARFSGEERHVRRLAKIAEIERLFGGDRGE